MEIRIRKSLFILSIIGAFILGVCLAGSVMLIKAEPSGTGSSGSGESFSSDSFSSDDKFTTLKNYVDHMYLNEYDEKAMQEGAYKGYISGLDDPYSEYMDADTYSSFMASATGTYEGVGITFAQDEDGNFVALEITKDSPAEKAGIKPGDILLTVDGVEYTDINIMASKIRGKAGTTVKLEYSHDDNVKEVELVRQKIVQQSIESKMLDDETGYIKVSSFIESTSDDFDKALSDLEAKGAKRLVLDLRDNGGGLVDESIDVADEFLDEGVVCYTEDKNGNTDSYDAVDGKTDLKTVVIVNENSASAAEILAGALKDNDFKIVGENSFGKGVIQTTVELKDGSALKLTIMQYLSPDKNVIHKKGIAPDYEVEDNEDTEKDEQLDKAIEVVEKL